MEEFIKKTDVLAEIKRRCEFHKERNRMEDSAIQDVLYGILNFLNTLETKDVNLEKELKILDNTLFDLDGVAIAGATHYLTVEDVKDIAKRFFELGLKAKEK